jgi:hypothetical protein
MCLPIGLYAASSAAAATTATAVTTAAAATTATSFLPYLSAAASVVGFGVQAFGASQSGQATDGTLAYRQSVLANNALIAQQDIDLEQENRKLRRELITRDFQIAKGKTIVAQAGLGQLVRAGSAADITDELAGEKRFKELFADQESALRVRNIQIAAANDVSSAQLLGLQRQAASTATDIQIAGGALNTASTLARRFRFSNGSLAFRT